MSHLHIIELKYSDSMPITTLLVSSLSFPHECIFKIKKMLSKLDRDNHRGRLNWDYMGSELTALIIKEWRHVRITQVDDEIRYLNNHTVIKPIESLYGDTNKSIHEVVHVTSKQGAKSEETLYSGSLDGYKRHYRIDELEWHAECREIDAFVVSKQTHADTYTLELLDPTIFSKAYGQAPTITVENVNALRQYPLALDYLEKTGTIILTAGEIDNRETIVHPSEINAENCSITNIDIT
ncbi:hypothetical protein VCHA53O466_140112 [Vibrio chagasii]|nr:hypothetical protein VCHA53O466_140112 [Vibrio chagasii]